MIIQRRIVIQLVILLAIACPDPFRVAAASTVSNSEPMILGRAAVVDGDTLKIDGIPIRLSGVDAPERKQVCKKKTRQTWSCGKAAADALTREIGVADLACRPLDRDRYGRIVALCYRGTIDLSEWLVSRGWAVAFRRYSLDYVASEDAARKRRAGIWAGSFEMPWDWRRAHR